MYKFLLSANLLYSTKKKISDLSFFFQMFASFLEHFSDTFFGIAVKENNNLLTYSGCVFLVVRITFLHIGVYPVCLNEPFHCVLVL